jgi:transcription elongation factor Elf1
MSPRNEAYRIPHSHIRMFQKEAKKMVNGPYYCPKCGKTQLQIMIASKNKEVHAICVCGIDEQLTYAPVFQGVDYYSKFLENYKKKQQS